MKRVLLAEGLDALGRRPRTRLPLTDRFWKKVAKGPGCWLWLGATDPQGYGQIQSGGRGECLAKAHRVSWELHYGPIPLGLLVCHHCDIPPCVRPDHLFLGTLSDNSRDCARKGRNIFQRHPEKHPRGERVHSAKLTADRVVELRRLRAEGWSQPRLASRFGISQAAAWAIVNGKTWREGPLS